MLYFVDRQHIWGLAPTFRACWFSERLQSDSMRPVSVEKSGTGMGDGINGLGWIGVELMAHWGPGLPCMTCSAYTALCKKNRNSLVHRDWAPPNLTTRKGSQSSILRSTLINGSQGWLPEYCLIGLTLGIRLSPLTIAPFSSAYIIILRTG